MSANQDFLTHHGFLVRKSGVSEKSAVAKEHRHLREALRLAMEHDQLDISNSTAFEYVTRRIVQIEAAAKRNPRQPDFEGLESIMDSPVDEFGATVVAEFSQWVADRQLTGVARGAPFRFQEARQRQGRRPRAPSPLGRPPSTMVGVRFGGHNFARVAGHTVARSHCEPLPVPSRR